MHHHPLFFSFLFLSFLLLSHWVLQVLADWDMIESSHRATDVTCSQMLEQIAGGKKLRHFRIRDQAGSIKVVPVANKHERTSLEWISSISSHQNQLLFGFSGAEFQARQDLLLAAKRRRGVDDGELEGLDIIYEEEDHLCEFVVTDLSDCA